MAVQETRKGESQKDNLWDIEAIAEVLGSKAVPLTVDRLGKGYEITFGLPDARKKTYISPDSQIVIINTGDTLIQFKAAKPPKINKESVEFDIAGDIERRRLHVTRTGGIRYRESRNEELSKPPKENSDTTEKPERIRLEGSVGAPPTYRLTAATDKPILRFPLVYNDNEGMKHVHTVVAFGDYATLLRPILQVGQQVGVIGYPKKRDFVTGKKTETIEDIHAASISVTLVPPRRPR